MSDAPPKTATSISSKPTATRKSRRRRRTWVRGSSASADAMGFLLQVGSEKVQVLLGRQGVGVVPLALKQGLGQSVLAGELGEGEIVRMGDEGGDGLVEPKQEVVDTLLDLADELGEL